MCLEAFLRTAGDHHLFHAIEPWSLRRYVTLICDSGFIPGSPSTVPSVTVVILPFSVPAKDELHLLQKYHPAPANVSYTFTWSFPEIHLKLPIWLIIWTCAKSNFYLHVWRTHNMVLVPCSGIGK